MKPVYEKMADIVARHIEGQGITDLWLAGGSCFGNRGVAELFRQTIPGVTGAFTAAQFVYDPAGDRQ
ncbi:ethanolamine utilization protein [Escherichia coli]|uniref:Ethanolamine utilization protein n=1 Tax=Escherichia coli TaxID=562 RepID=A0A2X1KZW9_ECOLX|nr:ethanolamine utilization protein [Escherichia coli]